jgi:hypothetical protein
VSFVRAKQRAKINEAIETLPERLKERSRRRAIMNAKATERARRVRAGLPVVDGRLKEARK